MDIIKELGLKIHMMPNERGDRVNQVVLVSDLRASFEKLPVVYGRQSIDHGDWEHIQLGKHTHKARLIGVEKLVKEPVRIERSFDTEGIDAVIIPDEIKGKPFKVVFEEVRGE